MQLGKSEPSPLTLRETMQALGGALALISIGVMTASAILMFGA